MPVFVEWKWKEQTKTFLVIFHYYDDFSSPNLRLKKYDKREKKAIIRTPVGEIETKKAWMTWAPSHVELGLLMNLLSYANIINGLKEAEKRKLRTELEGKERMLVECPFAGIKFITDVVFDENVRKEIGKEKKTVIYVEREEDQILHFCAELCPEYIDYLRKVMKPHLRS